MANLTGVLTGSMLLLLALNFVPGVHLSLAWQAIVAICLGATNLLVWQAKQIKPMSFREAAKIVALGCLLVGALAVVDTLIGFVSGQRTVWAAFIHSGAFGGIADAFLTTCGIFIGVPTLARSVYLYNSGLSSKVPAGAGRERILSNIGNINLDDEERDSVALLALESHDVSSRNAAAIALMDSHNPKAVAALVAAIEKKGNRTARGTLIYALSGFDCSSRFAQIFRWAIEGGFEASCEAITILQGQDLKPSEDEREECLILLGHLRYQAEPNEDLIDVLTLLLK